MEVKLTPEMFEPANWLSNTPGLEWDAMKDTSGSRLCSVDPIPFEGRVYIPIKTGYKFSIAQFDENKKNLGIGTYWDWRHTPQMCPLDSRTRYIGLCLGETGDVNKLSEIIGGGVLIMSNYPMLPIITTPEGFSYTRGYNLLFNSAFQNGMDHWRNWNGCQTREIVTVDNRKWLHVISQTASFQGVHQDWGQRGHANSSELVGGVGGMRMRISYTCYVSQATMGKAGAGIGVHLDNSSGEIITQYWRIVAGDETSTTPKRYSFEFFIPPGVDRFNFMVGKCNTENIIEAWFTDILVEYAPLGGDAVNSWRPNPADLIGGGVAYDDFF